MLSNINPKSYTELRATSQRRTRSFSSVQPTSTIHPKRQHTLDDDGDDSQEDAACPVGKNGRINMNQSIFQMITAAGSKSSFHGRSDDDSDSEGDSSDGNESPRFPNPLRSICQLPKRRKSPCNSRMLKSTPHLGLQKSAKSKAREESIQQITEEDPEDSKSSEQLLSEIMTRSVILDPHTEAHLVSAALGEGLLEKEAEAIQTQDDENQRNAALASKLMEIFGFSELEDIIAEYPCWLLDSALLSGYMYVTARHVCFYAYLPRKHDTTIKSGEISKRGKSNPKYNRYWFELKADSLTYYSDSKELYFPRGHINLRHAKRAAVTISPETGKETNYFTVTTSQREYYLKADSVPSAREWVKCLQKSIYQSHNEGDSIKIVLPIENVLEVEESKVMDWTDTLTIKVYEDPETFAIDEYFFSFFSFGKEACALLRSLSERTSAQEISLHHPTHSRKASSGLHDQRPQTPVLRETVKSTLTFAPMSPTSQSRSRSRSQCQCQGQCRSRSSTASLSPRSPTNTRRSFEIPRPRIQREISTQSLQPDTTGRDISNPASPQFSAASFDQSFHSTTCESECNLSSDEESASRILSGSAVFKSPIFNKPRFFSTSKPEHSEKSPSLNTASHYDGGMTEITVHPPTRANTAVQDKLQNESAAIDPILSTHEREHPSSLLHLVKTGGTPLHKAAGWAGWVRHTSQQKMRGLLSSQPMGYIEKVSDMWSGIRRHNGLIEGPQDEIYGIEGAGERFRAHFPSCSYDKLRATYFGYLHRTLPMYGKLYVSDRHFCFRSRIPGSRTKMVLPLKDIENVEKSKGYRFGYQGLIIVIRGHEELFFEFGHGAERDACWVTLLQNLDSIRNMQDGAPLSAEQREDAERAKREHKMLEEARKEMGDHDLQLPNNINTTSISSEVPPILFDDPQASLISFKPKESLKITCLTIGSRGDVQPYIALCKGLIKEGHRPKIATHTEFKSWIESHGIEFAGVGGDPAELMRICVENGMFTYSFLKEVTSKFRGWLDDLLESAWNACQGSDILIESPSAMAGIHIAEALEIPYFRAFTMPWTRTRAYPHAFAVPEHKMGGSYNYLTYVMFDNLFWQAIAGQINRWRKKTLKLPRTNLEKLQPEKVPFLYNFSPSVVAPPRDFSEWIRITGYWFLDEQSNWTPPRELLDFIRKARDDKKKLVYVGFGSIVVDDPEGLTKTVIESVLKADVRCILSKGWSDRLSNNTPKEVTFPPEIHLIQSAPHDWLFRQIDAATHHGGAGTTGASLRAGIPTIIKPFFGDQFFFGNRVEDLGVGICIKKLNVGAFSKALREATHNHRMIAKARILAEQIRKENGVETAIQAIYRDLERTRDLMKRSSAKTDESEESWTFVDSENEASNKFGEGPVRNRKDDDATSDATV